MTLPFQRRCRMTDCRRWNVVRCHQSQMPPDASRQLPPPPPGPAGAWGRSVERQSWCPLPRSRVTCCRRQCWGPPGCDDERRAPAVKSGVPLLPMSPVQRFCSALSFHQRVLQTFTICGPSVVDLSFHRLRPLGHRPRRLQTDASGHGVRRRRRILCSQRRPLTEAVAGPADFGARRAGCGCQAAAVLKYYKF